MERKTRETRTPSGEQLEARVGTGTAYVRGDGSMAEILIGTSGYDYKDWVGPFYPLHLEKKAYLSFFARHFDALELNYTYYRIPEAAASRAMLDKTGGELVFVVKANNQMTHRVPGHVFQEIVPAFLDGIRPFADQNRLGGILLQFPQSFHYTPRNRVYLKNLIDILREFPIFVEFRQREWIRNSVFESLNSLNAGTVCVDEPSLPSLPPSGVFQSGEVGYIRFHGRNREAWYGTDSTSRYDYLYTEEELAEWIPRVHELSRSTKRLFVFFNNHAKARAVTNARMLINLLK
jgi:uncharacterized protein YecE (DUF72 family)